MKRTRRLIVKLMILIIGVSFVFPYNVFAVEGNDILEKCQIIFLLDASKSMQGDGQWIEAADSACMIAAALPEGYEVALLVYNTEIVYQEDFGNIDQKTRQALETIELQGYTTPDVALVKAFEMFRNDNTDKRIVFISDGEISLRDEQENQKAVKQFENAVHTAKTQNIKIDMFEIPNEKTENQVSYGTEETSGELYTVDSNYAIEEITAKYLFETLQIEKVELGEALSDEGNLTVDLQDTYMQSAKLLFVSGEPIQNFHIAGQCEHLNIIQGNKFAVATLENPIKEQAVMDYCLKNRGNTHIYLMKEYFLKTDMEKTYTSEDGAFHLKINVLNHQDKCVLNADNFKHIISVFIDGENKAYEVSDGTIVIPYQAPETKEITVEINADAAGSIIHYDDTSDVVELNVPVVVIEEQPDYTVLWIVTAALGVIILMLSIIYISRSKKKTPVRMRVST